MSGSTDLKLLLKTGERHLFDAADLALEEASIPHNLEAYDVTGQRDQIHADSTPGPGSTWSIVALPTA